MRLLFRLLSMFALAIAVVMAVIDGTKSVAVDQLTLTPLGESWQSAAPEAFARTREAVENIAPVLWDPLATAILALPGWLVFAALSFLAYAIGRPRQGKRLSVG